MNKINIFSEVLYYEFLNLNLPEIEKYAFNLKEKTSGKFKSNFGGWQSFDLEKNEIERNLFINDIEQKIQKLNSEEYFVHNKTIELDNIWININYSKNFNVLHSHVGSLLSGVFYVTSPKDSGNISFRNPIANLIESYYFAQRVYTNIRKDFSDSLDWQISPEKNKILIFPSWIDHQVYPNITDEPRISISFNTKLRDKK